VGGGPGKEVEACFALDWSLFLRPNLDLFSASAGCKFPYGDFPRPVAKGPFCLEVGPS
jgi:hypothetical protein